MTKPVIVLAIIALIGVVTYSQKATIAQRIMARGLEARRAGRHRVFFARGFR